MGGKLILIGILVMLVFAIGVAAKPNLTPVNPLEGRATMVIPAHAVKVAPGVFSLGMAIDNGKVVEGYAIIDYKKGFGKPGIECGNGVCEPSENARKCPQDCPGNGEEPDTSSCYGFLARGAKWKTIEPYIINPANTEGLSGAFITSNLAADIDKWETAAGIDILGEGSSTSKTLIADTVRPDDKNEVYFADIAEPGAIGVTIVWGIFSGPPWARELVEWDQVYDQVDFDWSEDCESENCSTKMDFENIATHELGHSVGLDDLYEDRCSEQTMYGYGNYGETKKRTLESGDIKGIQELYA
jgi:hypothetical protein